MNKAERTILRKLLKNQYAMEKRGLETGIREEKKTIHDALTHLQALGYIVLDLTSSNYIISIPAHMRKDAFRIIYPGFLVDVEVAMEDQIPKGYDSTPIFTAEAEKEIHREISEYWFCAKKVDQTMLFVSFLTTAY